MPEDTVFVRVRPLAGDETGDTIHLGDKTGVVLVRGGPKTAVKPYRFDQILDTDAKQDTVYPPPASTARPRFHEVARPVMDRVLEGYNGTILAYGLSGTGKTFTMEGDRSEPERRGISFRVFDMLSRRAEGGSNLFQYSFSMCQVYCEKVSDLLDASRTDLSVRGTVENGFFVQNLSARETRDTRKLDEWFVEGSRNRTTAATNLNVTSSRSHCITIIRIRIERGLAGKFMNPTLFLVDLAGSENAELANYADKRQQDIGISINLSLTTLSKVINALVKKSSHIPYSDSVLTKLLSISLRGGAYTGLVLNVSANEKHVGQTISTLEFGVRAKSLPVRAQINEVDSSRAVVNLQKQLQAAEVLIQELKADEKKKDENNVSKALYDDLLGKLGQRNDEYIELNENYKKLLDEIDALTRERDELKNQVDQRTAELENANNDLQVQKGFVVDLRGRLAALEAQSASLSEELRKKGVQQLEADAQCRRLTEQEAQMQLRLDGLSSENAGLQESNAQLRRQSEQTEAAQRELQERFEALELRQAQESSASREALERVQAELAQTAGQLETRTQEVARMGILETQMKLERQTMESKCAMLSSDCSAAHQRYVEMTAQLDRLRAASREALARSVNSDPGDDVCDAIELRIRALKDDVTAGQSRCTALQESLQSREREVLDLTSQLNSLRAESERRERADQARLQQLDADLQKQQLLLDQTRTQAAGEKQRLEQSASDASERTERVERELRAARKSLSDVEGALALARSELERTASELRREKESSASEVARLTDERRQLERRGDEQSEELAGLQRRAGDQAAEITALQKAAAAREKQWVALSQSLQVVQTAVKDAEAERDALARRLEEAKELLVREQEAKAVLESKQAQEREEEQASLKRQQALLASERTTKEMLTHQLRKLEAKTAVMAQSQRTTAEEVAALSRRSEAGEQVQNALNERNRELRECNEQLVQLRAEYEALHAQYTEMVDCVKRHYLKDSELSKTVIFTMDLLDKLLGQSDETEKLRQRNDELKRSSEELRGAVERQREELSECRREIAELGNDLEDQRRRANSLEERISLEDERHAFELQEQEQSVEQFGGNDVEARNAQMASLAEVERLHVAVKSAVAERTTAVQSAASERAEFEKQIAEWGARFEQQQAVLAAEAGRAAALAEQSQERARLLEVGVTEARTLRSEKASLQKELSEARVRLVQAGEAQTQAQQLGVELQRSLESRRQLAADYDELSSRYRRMQADLAQRERENASLLQQHAELSANVASEEERAQALVSEIQRMRVSASSTSFAVSQQACGRVDDLQLQLQAARAESASKDAAILDSERERVQLRREVESMRVKLLDADQRRSVSRELVISEGDDVVCCMMQTALFSRHFRTTNVRITDDGRTASSQVPGSNCVFIDRVVGSREQFVVTFSVHDQTSEINNICFGAIRAPFNDLSVCSNQMYLFNIGQGLANRCPGEATVEKVKSRSVTLMRESHPILSEPSSRKWFPVGTDLSFDDRVTLFFDGPRESIRVLSEPAHEVLLEFAGCRYPMIPCVYTFRCARFSVDMVQDVRRDRR